eukprot:gnl/TRDRNA2_/TRDRNA2_171298_c1_seq1.p1 gnl/TRDRNA2_/TRDRNA2_171298_c1~~gnl/TRDRNA2_/TRDRNA2_171298_c1_seq1.p1  ORF type:complete len:115 (-),score=2.48 gnl/TRDRNA2_/TRDRNA2_171298_c1_seq1:85-429(-)
MCVSGSCMTFGAKTQRSHAIRACDALSFLVLSVLLCVCAAPSCISAVCPSGGTPCRPFPFGRLISGDQFHVIGDCVFAAKFGPQLEPEHGHVSKICFKHQQCRMTVAIMLHLGQ